MRYYIAYILFLCTFLGYSQGKGTVLDTVYLFAEKLEDKSVGQPIISISKAQLSNYRPQLTEVLQFETPIHFKENGFGMVSSASFRGTTAQQTAVVWNGININSPFLGQTDFNLINTQNISEVLVRPGGGSTQFGTGAIGGVVYLNNKLEVYQKNTHEISASYGSFNTKNLNTNHSISGKKTNLQIGVSYLDSDNDYKYLDTDNRNENGQFYNINASINGIYKLNAATTFKVYSNWFSGERHLSILETTQTRNKYTDEHLRLLGEYKHKSGKNQSTVKVALLNEKYRFYPELDTREGSNNGNGWTYIANYNYKVQFKKLLLNIGGEYNLATAKGTNYDNVKRNSGSANLYLKHQLSKKFTYQTTLRGELNEDYESPVLFSVGTNWQPIPEYALKIAISKNYRIPTFNDLYWPGAGNLDLKAESSLQYELSNELIFDNLKFILTGYYNDIDDLIRWLPYSGNLWRPMNTNSVKTYGIESNVNYGFAINNHQLKLNALYSYTISKNNETGYQLTYVPYHKATFGVFYKIKNFSTRINTIYTGEVFTHTNNNPDTVLNDFILTNLSANYTFGKKHNWIVGGGINNLFNSDYKTVSYRPMPGINYHINLTLKL
ncbi:TonB-dependent receptor [Aureibaculum sp. 2210JD6-5]|uniref:TonB-dependent receptor plug domain-containing protein n=1 Tax=Aureibaculum sp. 2210JD6-5 TaxID=3103957 RepID=UPI002AACDF74|nr:TonB-dependent receptor [Aureibaculum sp. 2210JD6-5]MDY7395135.1 TonB-dependent receptor [Aureibaculum sp. 2210JD6-5]